MDLHLERVIQKALEKNLMTDEQPSFVSQCLNTENPINVVICRIFLTLTTFKEGLIH